VRALLVAWVAGCGFAPAPVVGQALHDIDGGIASDADAAPPQPFHLRVAALIDGESHLIIHGTTLHWQHFDFAAPGRWNFVKDPIGLNGADWYPDWPDVPDSENRDCGGCMSSSTELPIGVPRAPATATWTEVQTRRAQGIVQQPSAANDYELIVLISDKGVTGAAEYIVDIDVTPN
jgi:hypothetical protein